MNNDFNRATFGQLPNGQSIQGNQQQQAFVGQSQLAGYGGAQLSQMGHQQIQLAHYMNATAQAATSAEQQIYSAHQLQQQMSARHNVARPNDFLAMQQMADGMHLPQQQQNYLQPSHYVNQPQAMMAGMSGQTQQLQSQYGMGQTNYQQNAYHQLYNLQQNQQNLYVQQQQSQFDHPSQSRMHSNIQQMAMPQTQQQVHRQSHVSIPQQQALLQQVASTSAASSLLLPQQKASMPQLSPSNLSQIQQQTVSHVPKQEKEAPAPQAEKSTRAYETALKASERAAAVAAENARIMKQKEETEERERQEQARIENERIQSELRRRRQDASEFTAAMEERLQAIPEPLHLATCHTLSKVGSYLPLPSECVAASETLPIYQPYPDLAQMNATQPMAEYLAALLNYCMNEIGELELKHKDDEMNDLEVEEMTPMCRAIHDFDPNALSVESDADLLLFDSHFEQAVEEELATNNILQPTANQTNVQSTSCFTAPEDHQPASIASSESSQHQSSEEQAQLRRQMVSLGKQPRAAPTRKKKDMVASLYV